MIQPQELRIGNYILSPSNEIAKVTTVALAIVKIDEGGLKSITDYKLVEPIELTEEWLVKLGFQYYESNKSYQLDTDFGVTFWGRNGVINTYCESNEFGNEMTFAHQIQNRYYSLSSGQELTIKE